MLACASCAHEPAHDLGAGTTPTAALPDERAETAAIVETPTVSTGSDPAPSATRVEPEACFTRVHFDLRSMPHRGPHDVDGRLVTSRIELLMQRVRDAAAEPAPRLSYTPGVSAFRADFTGPDAMAQCRRVVAAVATASRDDPGPRGDFGGVRATPCAPIDDEQPASEPD